MRRGFSVHIHLVDGTPDGLWQVTRSNWTGRGLAMPRAHFKEVKERPELKGTGVYMLLGEDEGEETLYVGEAEDLATRLSQHVQDIDKDFRRIVAFTASGDGLNKAHARYLESRLIRMAKEAGQARIMNAASSPATSISAWERDDMDEFLENIRLLLPIMGVSALEHGTEEVGKKIYFFRGRGANARAQYRSDGVLVLKGSVADPTESKSFQGGSEQRLRRRLIEEGILAEVKGQLKLTRDHLFPSPSAAAGVMAGSGYNGWIQWKDEKGTTLDENERAAVGVQE